MKNNKILLTLASFLIIGQAQAIDPVYEGDNGIKAKVFATNCLGCHSSDLEGGERKRAPRGVDYDSYSAAVDNGNRAVQRAAVLGSMPPNPSFSLSEEQKIALKNWKALGFPEKTMPPIYSLSTSKLNLPKVYVQDAAGNILTKYHVGMNLIPASNPLKFEVTKLHELTDADMSGHK